MSTRVVLLASSPRVAPGLLSVDAWRLLDGATSVRSTRPGATVEALRAAGIEVQVDEGGPSGLVHAFAAEPRGGGTAVVLLTEGDDADALERALVEGGAGVQRLEGSWDLPGAHLLDAVTVMDRLRGPGGCPWDAEQTHESLAPYALEEAGEVVEAIAGLQDGSHHYEDVKEELGDLLLQVLFHARVATEAPAGASRSDAPFDIDDVADALVAKLVRRHPHVFGDSTAATPEEVSAQWQQIKARERADKARRRATPG